MGHLLQILSRGRWWTNLLVGGLLTAGALWAGGCASKTETGYEPHRLGMTDTQLRALYAPEFTPEAHAADDDKSISVKPGRGVGMGY